jgi:hypothetical protein
MKPYVCIQYKNKYGYKDSWFGIYDKNEKRYFLSENRIKRTHYYVHMTPISVYNFLYEKTDACSFFFLDKILDRTIKRYKKLRMKDQKDDFLAAINMLPDLYVVLLLYCMRKKNIDYYFDEKELKDIIIN